MGTVHGVYLKYVGLSALSGVGCNYLLKAAASSTTLGEARSNRELAFVSAAAVLGYSTLLNGLIAVLFRLEAGMGLIGKDRKTGKIPLWSYVVYFPFHYPTWLYTKISNSHHKVEAATEVEDGWWIGGRDGHTLNRDFAGVIDVTVEFPEMCMDRITTEDGYLSLPSWDGVPNKPAVLEEAATHAVRCRKHGDVLVHCAHGRGRSTTVMVACLVKAGLYPTWEEAFEKGVKPKRSICKLNKKMKKALTEWQDTYVKKTE